MFDKLLGRPSRDDLQFRIDMLMSANQALAQANHELIANAHFRDTAGKILPKGKLPPQLIILRSVEKIV